MVYESLLATLYLSVGILTTLLGLVILREDPGVRLNRATALMLFFAGIGAFLGAGSLWVDQAGHGVSTLRSSLVANFAYLWEFFFPSLVLFSGLFPVERPILRRHSWSDLVLFLPHTSHFFLMFFATILGSGFGLENAAQDHQAVGPLLSLARVLLKQFFTWHRQLFSAVNLAYVAIAIFLIAHSLALTHKASLRSQLRTILRGVVAGVLLYVVAVPLNLLAGLNLSGLVSSTLVVAALAIWAGTIAYAIVRHRFLDLRWIVRRTILYALVSAIVVGVYLQVVRRLAGVLSDALLVPPGVLDWVALVVPLVFLQPTMGRLEESMEGWFLRGRRELRSVMVRLSEKMTSSLEFDPIVEGLVVDLPDAVSATGAAVLLRQGDGVSGDGYRTVASRGLDEATVALLEHLSVSLPETPAGGRPHTSEEWFEVARSNATSRAEIEPQLLHWVPHLTYELRHGGSRLGLYVLGQKASGMRYRSEEIALLGSVVSQAGVALKNSLLYRENLGKAVLEEELALARKIQQAFLPTRFPCGLPIEVFGLNLPSKQVGGDYYDFFRVDDRTYAVAVADVAGKGVPAALLASMLQASLRTLLRDNRPISFVMDCVNRLVCESTRPEQFITLLAGVLDVERLELTYCNAGHNYPLFCRRGQTARLLEHSDLVLGIDGAASYKEQTVDLKTGDSLLLYTDGITEAKRPDGDDFGERRLRRLLDLASDCSADRLVGRIRDEVLGFAEAEDPQDDMTLLCIRVP